MIRIEVTIDTSGLQRLIDRLERAETAEEIADVLGIEIEEDEADEADEADAESPKSLRENDLRDGTGQPDPTAGTTVVESPFVDAGGEG